MTGINFEMINATIKIGMIISLAGVVVSLLNPDEEMVEKLDSFGYGFFIPIFFIIVISVL
jgi:Kef-type K+ transport system membrane component KefB